jgi:hypothetical protein
MPNRTTAADRVAEDPVVTEDTPDKRVEEGWSVLRGLERCGGIAKPDELAERTEPKVSAAVVTKSLKTLEEQGTVWTMPDGRIALSSSFPKNVAVTG